jgi:hypothetical protein
MGSAALDQGAGYGVVLGLGAAFALGESRDTNFETEQQLTALQA